MGMVKSPSIAFLVILSLSFAEQVSLTLPNLIQSQDRFSLNNKSLGTISFWANCDQIPALLQETWKGDFQHLGGNKTKHSSQKAGSLFQPHFHGEQCLSINQGHFLLFYSFKPVANSVIYWMDFHQLWDYKYSLSVPHLSSNSGIQDITYSSFFLLANYKVWLPIF